LRIITQQEFLQPCDCDPESEASHLRPGSGACREIPPVKPYFSVAGLANQHCFL